MARRMAGTTRQMVRRDPRNTRDTDLSTRSSKACYCQGFTALRESAANAHTPNDWRKQTQQSNSGGSRILKRGFQRYTEQNHTHFFKVTPPLSKPHPFYYNIISQLMQVYGSMDGAVVTVKYACILSH